MDKKPAPRHEKMYKDSPKIESDENGKKVLKKKKPDAKKPEGEAKKAAETNSGTEGIGVHEQKLQEMHHKHAKERMALFQKHEQEHLATMQEAAKEGVPATGGEMIEKTESDEKE